jgi:hypothetical protein
LKSRLLSQNAHGMEMHMFLFLLAHTHKWSERHNKNCVLFVSVPVCTSASSGWQTEAGSEVIVACLRPANSVGRQISLAIPGLTRTHGSRKLRDKRILY